MALSLPLISAAVLVWVLWKVFRNYVVPSPLDNIPGPPRSSFWSGDSGIMYQRHGWSFHDGISEKYGPVSTTHTLLGARGLYVYDPKALQSIMIKDQDLYEEPAWLVQSSHAVFGPAVFITQGEQHRRQRKVLDPVFSGAHMRYMAPVFYDVAHRVREAISSQIHDAAGEVDVIEWTSRAALELIGQGGLGCSLDPLVADTNNEFGAALKALIPLISGLHFYRMLMPYVTPFIPPSVRRLLMRWVPHTTAQRLRAVTEDLWALSRKIYEEKLVAIAKGNDDAISEGQDLISILVRSNTAAVAEDRLPEEEIIAQVAALVLAATDTTSSALARILHILAERQDIQDTVRAELVEAAGEGEDIPYDQLVDLPWLDSICRETMRLHPPANIVNREARTDIIMPLSEPVQGRDGTLIHEIAVPKGTLVTISLRGCNRNKALWGEDALEWKPERWLKPLPKTVSGVHIPGVYAHLMTFIGGAKACLGFRFAQLEMKVVLAVMLRSFRFHLSDKEVYWNFAGVNFPSVGRDGKKAAMPMKVETL